jgi:hypothetical protein
MEKGVILFLMNECTKFLEVRCRYSKVAEGGIHRSMQRDSDVAYTLTFVFSKLGT